MDILSNKAFFTPTPFNIFKEMYGDHLNPGCLLENKNNIENVISPFYIKGMFQNYRKMEKEAPKIANQVSTYKTDTHMSNWEVHFFLKYVL